VREGWRRMRVRETDGTSRRAARLPTPPSRPMTERVSPPWPEASRLVRMRALFSRRRPDEAPRLVASTTMRQTQRTLDVRERTAVFKPTNHITTQH